MRRYAFRDEKDSDVQKGKDTDKDTSKSTTNKKV